MSERKVRFFKTVVFSPRHSESKLSLCSRLRKNVRFFKTVVFSPRHSESKLSLCSRLRKNVQTLFTSVQSSAPQLPTSSQNRATPVILSATKSSSKIADSKAGSPIHSPVSCHRLSMPHRLETMPQTPPYQPSPQPKIQKKFNISKNGGGRPKDNHGTTKTQCNRQSNIIKF